MSESLLNRQFQQKDVNRMRNLLTLKYGEGVTSQIGYSRKKQDHEEGDMWEENGKFWTIKNGIKQSFTKMDALKKSLRMPMCCPKCKTKMKHHHDPKYYAIHQMCFDCSIKFETTLRAEGKYQEYSMNFQIKNALTWVGQNRIALNEHITTSKDIYYSEEGEKQVFIGGSYEDGMVKEWFKSLDNIENELKSKINDSINKNP